MSFGSQLFEHLFQINFQHFIHDREAIPLFKTCKTTYYRCYPHYLFKAWYPIEVVVDLLDNKNYRLGGNSFNPRLTCVSWYIFISGTSTSSLGSSGASLLAKIVEANKTVTTINLNNNYIIKTSGISSLAKALEVNKTITTIYLGSNQIGASSASSLAKALEVNKTITTIYLGFNQIGDEGAFSLARALEVNKTITTIYLQYNKIRELGIASLIKALEVNKSVTTIWFNGNQIQNSSEYLLIKALELNKEAKNGFISCTKMISS